MTAELLPMKNKVNIVYNMFLSSFRILKFSLQDIFRNFSLSIMTILILVLMLLSINTLIVVRILTDQSINEIKKQIDVSIYFNPDATEKEITEVRSFVGSFPEVEKEIFLTKEDALVNFKENYKDNKEILASLDELGENPLGPTLILKTREPIDYQKIIKAISVPEYENIIEAKTFADTEIAINRIESITSQVEKFSMILTVLFGLIAFVIIFNTIRVIIYTQRVEIGIKRLVGATNWFIRGPYLVESFIFSVVSIGITAVSVYFAISFLDPYIGVIFNDQLLLTNYFKSHIIWLLNGQFIGVLFLTVVSSSLAMRRYLRV